MEASLKGFKRRLQLAGKDKLNVFLVDDDESYLKVMSHQLKAILGGRVNITTFTNGQQCMASLHMNPDVVFMDHYLDDQDKQLTGLTFLKQIKAWSDEIQVVLISGLDDMKLAAKAIKEGAMDFVAKGRDAMSRIIRDVQKVVLKLIKDKEEKEYKRFKTVVFAVIGAIAVGVAVMHILFPSVTNL